MTEIARLPYDAATGAEIDIVADTFVNESAGGISGRSTGRRSPIRQFHLTIGPQEAVEVRSLHYTHRRRWPVALRDWGKYTFDDELAYEQDTGHTLAPLRTRIAPSTGSRFLYQRILVPDEAEVATVVTVDGTPLDRDVWTFGDFGIVSIPNELVPSGAAIRAAGRYLVAACFVSDTLTEKVLMDGLLELPDVALREILEPELIALMAQPDDSV